MRAFDPIEPIGAEQDEMDQQRQNEEENTSRHEHASWVEKKPKPPHVASPSDELLQGVNDQPTGVVKPRRRVAVRSWKPGPPLPREEVRHEGDRDEADEAIFEDLVELLSLGLG
jgi:hypothetical protein